MKNFIMGFKRGRRSENKSNRQCGLTASSNLSPQSTSSVIGAIPDCTSASMTYYQNECAGIGEALNLATHSRTATMISAEFFKQTQKWCIQGPAVRLEVILV
jgi:hypothetical protein